jgi:EAL domain-containing protein (putative c-di-GMP-specific phosphodiesterase class I)
MVLKVTSIALIEPAIVGVEANCTPCIDINFQPQHDLGTKEIVAFEGLGHWDRVLADWLYPQSAQTGTTQEALGQAINLALITHSARAAFMWRSQGFNIDVWIKLRARDLLNLKFSHDLLASILKEQAEPDWLILEVDEQELAGAGNIALSSLEVLSGLGFKIALAATGAPILAFDKRMRALFSYLKCDAPTSLKLARAPQGPQTRAFARRIKAVQAAGVPIIVSGLEPKDEKSSYCQIGFTRYQSCDTEQALTIDMATRHLVEQLIGMQIRMPIFTNAPHNFNQTAQCVEDILVDNLRHTHHSMLRLVSLEPVPEPRIKTQEAA